MKCLWSKARASSSTSAVIDEVRQRSRTLYVDIRKRSIATRTKCRGGRSSALVYTGSTQPPKSSTVDSVDGAYTSSGEADA